MFYEASFFFILFVVLNTSANSSSQPCYLLHREVIGHIQDDVRRLPEQPLYLPYYQWSDVVKYRIKTITLGKYFSENNDSAFIKKMEYLFDSLGNVISTYDSALLTNERTCIAKGYYNYKYLHDGRLYELEYRELRKDFFHAYPPNYDTIDFKMKVMYNESGIVDGFEETYECNRGINYSGQSRCTTYGKEKIVTSPFNNHASKCGYSSGVLFYKENDWSHILPEFLSFLYRKWYRTSYYYLDDNCRLIFKIFLEESKTNHIRGAYYYYSEDGLSVRCKCFIIDREEIDDDFLAALINNEIELKDDPDGKCYGADFYPNGLPKSIGGYQLLYTFYE